MDSGREGQLGAKCKVKSCNFCDYVKNGSGRSWDDLDKDVSMLMETADKLSLMLAEKEISSPDGDRRPVCDTAGKPVYRLKELKNADSTETASFDESEEIVEEKKVSLSFLEKFT